MTEFERCIAERKGEPLPSDDTQQNDWPEPIDTCTPEYRALLERVVKGAEFITSLPPNDVRYKPAMAKYDKLCEEAMKMNGMTEWERVNLKVMTKEQQRKWLQDAFGRR